MEELTLDRLMTATEIATQLHVSLRTFWRLRSAGRLPEPIRLGAALRWRRDLIGQWIAEGCPAPTSCNNGKGR